MDIVESLHIEIDGLQAEIDRLRAEANRTCEWHPQPGKLGYWKTECGELINIYPEPDGIIVKFCPHCSRRVVKP